MGSKVLAAAHAREYMIRMTLLKLGALRSVADQHQPRRRQPALDLVESRQNQRQILLRREASHMDRNYIMFGAPQLLRNSDERRAGLNSIVSTPRATTSRSR